MINETLIFHTCGICEREFGLRDCRLLNELSWEIENSSLTQLCYKLKKAGRDFENLGDYSIYEVFNFCTTLSVYFNFLFAQYFFVVILFILCVSVFFVYF